MHTSVLPPLSPLTSPPRSSVSLSSSQMPPTSSGTRVNTVILFVIVILAIVFFLSGLLHLLLRFLSKKRSSRPSPEMNRSADNIAPDSLQRQLQQLFHLHDSGLDQALIDSLPVFLYKEIMGSKEPFDCAVCLCEFSMEDSLRLLPVCSHAFHLHCIDTWLLSNSTCPLCRGLIYSDIPLFYFDESSEEHVVSVQNGDKKPVETEDTVHEKRILPVKLGKYRRLDTECGNEGETSSSSLDARRCFSMGAVQYVVGDSNLQVALEEVNHTRRDHEGITDQEDMERKKLSNVSKGDSYSVSKIWLWTKKGKASIPLDGNKNSSFNLNIPSNGGNFHI